MLLSRWKDALAAYACARRVSARDVSVTDADASVAALSQAAWYFARIVRA